MRFTQKNKLKIGVIVLTILATLCMGLTLSNNNKSSQAFLGNLGYAYQRCKGFDGVFRFYNVDNADASLIYTNQEIGLIDTGLKETAGILLHELTQFKTQALDFVVISHPHSDHAGGYLQLLKEIQVKRLFIGYYSQNDFKNISLYKEIIEVSNLKGVEIIYVTHGMKADIGGISLQFWDGSHSSVDENHNSLLVKATIGNKSCLFTGDAGKQAELDLISLGCDVSADILKVGHHGSNTASSLEFLQAVRPLYSVISVGYNEYGHPHDKTIENLSNVGTRVYRTDICNKISFKIQNDIIDVTVE